MIDLETAKPIRKNPAGQDEADMPFDVTTAEPVTKYPSEVYTRNKPTNEFPSEMMKYAPYGGGAFGAEAGVAVAALLFPKETAKTEQALRTPKVQSINQALTQDILFPPFAVMDAARGVAAASSPTDNIWSMIVESAKKGVLEPDSVPHVSASLMAAYPKTDWKFAALIGTVAELGLVAPSILKTLGQMTVGNLTANAQKSMALARMFESPQWERGVKAASEMTGTPMDVVDSALKRHAWENKDKVSYWTALATNIEAKTGVNIKDERGFVDFSPKEPEPKPPLTPAVEVDGEIFTGKDHGEAIEKARSAGKDVSKIDREKAGRFLTATGQILTREMADKLYGAAYSHEIKDIPTSPEPKTEAPEKFTKARIRQLQGESNNLVGQIETLEKQKVSNMSKQLPTANIDRKLEKLNHQYDLIDEQIANHMIDRTTLSDLKGKALQMKVNEILDLQAESKREGFVKGAELQKQRFARLQEKMTEAKAISKMDKYLKRSMAEEVSQILSDIKKTDTTNLPVDYKDRLEEIKSNFDLHLRTGKTLATRESMKKFVDKQLEEGNPITIPEEDLDLMNKKPLNELTMSDLRKLHDDLMRIYHQGRVKNQLLSSQKERNFETYVDKAVKAITQNEGFTGESTIEQAMKKNDESLSGKSKSFIKDLIIENLRPELMFNMMDNYDLLGPMTTGIWDPLNESRNSELESSDKSEQMLNEILTSILKDNLRTETYKIGRFNSMTKNNALFIYAHSFNEDGVNHLKGSGITEQDIKDVARFISDEEKQTIMKMFDFYDVYDYPRIDKLSQELTGSRLKKAPYYFPFMGLEREIEIQEWLEPPTTEKEFRGRAIAGVERGFTKERLGTEEAFKSFDFLETIQRHHDRVEHYLAYGKEVRDVNKILSDPRIKGAIISKYGDRFYNVLSKWLKDAARDRTDFGISFVGRMSRWLRTRYAGVAFGFNLSTTMKQLSGLSQGAQLAGKEETVKAMFTFLKDPEGSWKFVMGKSKIMKFRGMRQEREFIELMRQSKAEERLKGISKGYRKFSQIMLMPVQLADRYVATVVWMGSYENSLKSGISEVDAIKEADRVVRRTQPMGDLIDLPDMFRGPEYQKMFTFAQGHVNKFTNLNIEMISRKKRGVDSNGRFINNLIFLLLAPALYISTVERKHLPKNIGQVLESMGDQLTQGIIPVSLIYRAMTKKYYSGSTPLEAYLNDLRSMVMAKKSQTKLAHGLDLVGSLIGLPMIEARRAIRAIEQGDLSQLIGVGEKEKEKSGYVKGQRGRYMGGADMIKRGGGRIGGRNRIQELLRELKA